MRLPKFKWRDRSHPRSQGRRWLVSISQVKRLHPFPSSSTVPLPSNQPMASNPQQTTGKTPQETAPTPGRETLGSSAEETPRNPELAKSTCNNRLPGSAHACRGPASQEFSCQTDFFPLKKEDFSVSNPVVSAFPMGSVNHFLLADRNNFSFRNGTFMFCGFSVYTHLATLCQHLLMNKYITQLS